MCLQSRKYTCKKSELFLEFPDCFYIYSCPDSWQAFLMRMNGEMACHGLASQCTVRTVDSKLAGLMNWRCASRLSSYLTFFSGRTIPRPFSFRLSLLFLLFSLHHNFLKIRLPESSIHPCFFNFSYLQVWKEGAL